MFTVHVGAMLSFVNFSPLLYSTVHDQGICQVRSEAFSAEGSFLLGID